MINLQKSFEKKDIAHVLELLDVESLAWSTNFYKRSPQKITASSFIMGFWQMQQKGKNTLRNWAVQIGNEIQDSVNKQSLDNRLNPSGLELCKKLLEKALNARVDSNWLAKEKQKLGNVLNFFNRIILEDSTVQQIPTCLYEQFSGNTTQAGHRALMRIQAFFNFTEERWKLFSVDTYSQNDQSQAKLGLDFLEQKDLLLRDLGYFVLSALETVVENQYVITSYKKNVNLFHPNGEPIDLLEMLKEKSQIDLAVLVGSENRIPMRLVARKLSEKQKKRRIQEAKKKAHTSNNHSKEYFELLGYEIFLTNIDSSILNIEQISKLYGLRWYIEILFKAWKSYFNFKTIFEKDKMTYERTMISIYLILIEFAYLTNYIYFYIRNQVNMQCEKTLSVLKFTDVVHDLFETIINIKALSELDVLICNFAKNAVYENRNNRKNMKEKYHYFKELNTV